MKWFQHFYPNPKNHFFSTTLPTYSSSNASTPEVYFVDSWSVSSSSFESRQNFGTWVFLDNGWTTWASIFSPSILGTFRTSKLFLERGWCWDSTLHVCCFLFSCFFFLTRINLAYFLLALLLKEAVDLESFKKLNLLEKFSWSVHTHDAYYTWKEHVCNPNPAGEIKHPNLVELP